MARPKSVAVTGWFFFGIAVWMSLSVFSYLAVSGVLRPSLPAGHFLESTLWTWIAAAEAVLGPAMIVTSLRFLKLRRWTLVLLKMFGGILVLGTLAFGVFWVVQVGSIFSEMRGGPDLGATGSVVLRVFQTIMIIGGVAVTLTFAAGFALLVKCLCALDTKASVKEPGF